MTSYFFCNKTGKSTIATDFLAAFQNFFNEFHALNAVSGKLERQTLCSADNAG